MKFLCFCYCRYNAQKNLRNVLKVELDYDTLKGYGSVEVFVGYVERKF